jgi:tetratricopeptide (TPR) repeat protein
MDEGDADMKNQQYAAAEKAYREAFTLAEASWKNDTRLATNLLTIAQAANAQSEPAKKEDAEAMASRAIEALEKAVKAHRPKDSTESYQQTAVSAAILASAADIFASHQKYEFAEDLDQRVIRLWQDAAEDKPPHNNEDFFRFLIKTAMNAQGSLANAYEKLAALYFQERKFEKAARLYEKSQPIRENPENPKADKRPLAQLLGNLASCYAMENKVDQAEPLFQRAITLYEKSSWLETPEAATTMQNYAFLLTKMARTTEAKAMLEKAQAIQTRLQRSAP